MIKYLGSKRLLVPVLGALATGAQARDAVDLFSGTSRVGQEFKRLGITTGAVDLATYAHVLAQTYIATDARAIDSAELGDAIAALNALPGRPGYVTRTFCEEARFFQPHNGARIDAIRDAIEEWAGSALYPILLTALLEAADRVDSTTGLHMAYLKSWAPRSYNPLVLREPTLLAGSGSAWRADALEWIADMAHVDLAYLDPPYNQHRYFTNYHIWETLVRWDAPESYGVARKRIDARGRDHRSAFNTKRCVRDALETVLTGVRANVVVLSYSDEAWVSAGEVCEILRSRAECVRVLSYDYRRYIGAKIGVHGPDGRVKGPAGAARNHENIYVAGPGERVERAVRAALACEEHPGAAPLPHPVLLD